MTPGAEESFVKPRRKHLVIIGLASMAVAILVAGWWFFVYTRTPRITVPENITSKASFPIQLPRDLPGTYAIDEASFMNIEQGGIAFRAKDSTNSSVFFTEQARPSNMNFTEFYKEGIRDGKVLDGTPHASFVGKTFDNKTNVLSVVTDKTWLLATTNAPLTEEQMREISRSLYEHK